MPPCGSISHRRATWRATALCSCSPSRPGFGRKRSPGSSGPWLPTARGRLLRLLRWRIGPTKARAGASSPCIPLLHEALAAASPSARRGSPGALAFELYRSWARAVGGRRQALVSSPLQRPGLGCSSHSGRRPCHCMLRWDILHLH